MKNEIKKITFWAIFKRIILLTLVWLFFIFLMDNLAIMMLNKVSYILPIVGGVLSIILILLLVYSNYKIIVSLSKVNSFKIK